MNKKTKEKMSSKDALEERKKIISCAFGILEKECHRAIDAGLVKKSPATLIMIVLASLDEEALKLMRKENV